MDRDSHTRSRDSRRGGALLAVLWLSVALSAIAFALSRGVRADFDRAALSVDSTRAYYLAQGAIEAALQKVSAPSYRRADDPEAAPGEFRIGQRFLRFSFASGKAEVEIIGENGKLDVNRAEADQLVRLLRASGADPSQAVTAARGIIAYREQVRNGQASFGMGMDQMAAQFGFQPGSAFSRPDTSIQEVEELLVVEGVTPDLMWGGYREDDEGRLVRFEGLAGNLTTRGQGAGLNMNYASREMLEAAGLSQSAIESAQEIRRDRPLTQDDPGMAAAGDRFGDTRLGLGGESRSYTLRATAELRNGRAKRTVAAMVEIGGSGPDPIRIVRWYDTAF